MTNNRSHLLIADLPRLGFLFLVLLFTAIFLSSSCEESPPPGSILNEMKSRGIDRTAVVRIVIYNGEPPFAPETKNMISDRKQMDGLLDLIQSGEQTKEWSRKRFFEMD